MLKKKKQGKEEEEEQFNEKKILRATQCQEIIKFRCEGKENWCRSI